MRAIFILFLTFLLFYTCSTFATDIKVSTLNELQTEEIELDYSILSNLERNQSIERDELKSDINLILKSKFKLINGDIKMSEFYLNQINSKTTKLNALKNRYLSLIKFIDGKFQESNQLLSEKYFSDPNPYREICILKLMNYMALNKRLELKNEFELCQSLTQKFSKNDQFWLNILFYLKTYNLENLNKSMITNVEATLKDDEMSRLWLKSGLFLNREKDMLKILSILPENSYSSSKIREIVALMYLRDNDKEKALMFVDDLNTANAENIKGNIYLQNKQYELAFGQFKLALLKKADSENALERAIPLSWLLGQFEDGLFMINKIPNKNYDERKKLAIRVAMLIRLKKFKEARDELEFLKDRYKNIPPFEVMVMDSYVNIILGVGPNNKKISKSKIEESSELGCKSFDGISCWISLSHMHWDNIGKTVKRQEKTLTDQSLDLEELKKEVAITPLIELKTIDQRDIEELDSQLVQLKN